MKVRLNLTTILAAVALSLAVIEWIHPFGGRPRLSPSIVVVILLLVGVRYAARQQAQKREEIMKAVPDRPLGLSDDAARELPHPDHRQYPGDREDRPGRKDHPGIQSRG